MKTFILTLTVALVVAGNIAPSAAYAWRPGVDPLVPCSGVANGSAATFSDPCGFDDIIEMINNFVTLALYLVVPIIALTFAYAGFLYLTSGGDQSKAKDAKKIFTRTLWGLLWMFGAWLIVKAIAVALLDPTQNFNTFLQ